MTFPEYLAKLAPPPAKGSLHSEPFFANPPYDLSNPAAGKPVAAFFEQKDCAGCDTLHRKVLSQPATRTQLKRFHVIQLDRWSDTPVVSRQGARPAPDAGPTS